MKVHYYLSFLPLFLIGIIFLQQNKTNNKSIEIIYFKQNDVSALLDTINNVVEKNRVPILYFNADWCGPCKRITKSIQDGNVDKYNKITLIVIDERICSEIFIFFQIRHVPYIAQVDASFNIINNNILNISVSNKWKKPNKDLDSFLLDLYHERPAEELQKEIEEKNKVNKLNEFEGKIKSDTSLSIYSRNNNKLKFDKYLYNLDLKYVEIDNINDTMRLNSLGDKQAFSIKLYASILEPKDLIEVLNLFLKIKKIQTIDIVIKQSIPNQLFELSHLKHLSIYCMGNNEIKNLNKIGQFKNLETLYFASTNDINHINNLDDNLLNLKELVFHGLNIVPHWILNSPNLAYLECYFLKSENLELIGKIKNLKYLKTNKFNKDFNELKHLNVLILSDESEEYSNLDALQELEVLIIDNKYLKELPDANNFKKLKVLKLSNNLNLTSIPESYSSLEKLDYLLISNNEKLVNSLHTNLSKVKYFIGN